MGRPEGAGGGGTQRGPKFAPQILGLNQCDALVQCAQLASCTWRRLSRWATPIRVPPRVITAACSATEPWCQGLNNRPAHSSASPRSEEHTSELQSLMRISYAVFCLKKKKHRIHATLHYTKRI